MDVKGGCCKIMSKILGAKMLMVPKGGVDSVQTLTPSIDLVLLKGVHINVMYYLTH